MILKKNKCYEVIVIGKLNFKVARWQWSKFGLVVELRTFTVPLTNGSVPEADSDAQHSLVRC
jgi:hypothetical protein